MLFLRLKVEERKEMLGAPACISTMGPDQAQRYPITQEARYSCQHIYTKTRLTLPVPSQSARSSVQLSTHTHKDKVDIASSFSKRKKLCTVVNTYTQRQGWHCQFLLKAQEALYSCQHIYTKTRLTLPVPSQSARSSVQLSTHTHKDKVDIASSFSKRKKLCTVVNTYTQRQGWHCQFLLKAQEALYSCQHIYTKTRLTLPVPSQSARSSVQLSTHIHKDKVDIASSFSKRKKLCYSCQHIYTKTTLTLPVPSQSARSSAQLSTHIHKDKVDIASSFSKRKKLCTVVNTYTQRQGWHCQFLLKAQEALYSCQHIHTKTRLTLPVPSQSARSSVQLSTHTHKDKVDIASSFSKRKKLCTVVNTYTQRQGWHCQFLLKAQEALYSCQHIHTKTRLTLPVPSQSARSSVQLSTHTRKDKVDIASSFSKRKKLCTVVNTHTQRQGWHCQFLLKAQEARYSCQHIYTKTRLTLPVLSQSARSSVQLSTHIHKDKVDIASSFSKRKKLCTVVNTYTQRQGWHCQFLLKNNHKGQTELCM